MTEHILIERPAEYQGVLVIRFNRPEKKNAITRPMYVAMTDALDAANHDEAIRALAILGTEGCFCAGNDMADFLAMASGGVLGQEVLGFLAALVNCRKPIVAGVDGLAIGIGTTINFHCDMSFATSRTYFRTPFVDLALVPEAASSLLGPLVMGHQRAFAMLAAGEGFSAKQALDAGLIWKIVDDTEIEAATLGCAASLAAKPPQALQIARDLIRKDRGDVAGRIAEEAAHFGAQLQSAEAKAAFHAFMTRKS